MFWFSNYSVFRHLNCPVTDHTYDDCRLMVRAARLKLPMEAGLVEFQKLHQKLGFVPSSKFLFSKHIHFSLYWLISFWSNGYYLLAYLAVIVLLMWRFNCNNGEVFHSKTGLYVGSQNIVTAITFVWEHCLTMLLIVMQIGDFLFKRINGF